MASDPTTPSARQIELLESAYKYALTHGLADMSLRPLAAAIGSSPRVLLFLFGSKDGLVRALLARARSDELAVMDRLRHAADPDRVGFGAAVDQIWGWLTADEHQPLLKLWTEAYARSLVEPEGAWAGFARDTVEDWLEVLAEYQAPQEKSTAEGIARRTLALAVVRGGLLDLLATGDKDRVSRAVRVHLATLGTD
ncbi:TetR family transcriptional regulator [Mycobacterium sp. 852013-50091_SCH5140682]|uniref:TetR/AcrR family transcriptional regulator n=1 Tax=Mycobacterium sp. 852013-50091_SCH5140682 TaxID=1834109 RepID=UPI0007EBB5E1|nr:TetR family transcriptional regulator [Mycobacterium sp. 852013-50091_SCH5140682]OBC14208.1 TetR family transcriptional regulator [Mycobacterium sp. 852013-50091_SCH5140682]